MWLGALVWQHVNERRKNIINSDDFILLYEKLINLNNNNDNGSNKQHTCNILPICYIAF